MVVSDETIVLEDRSSVATFWWFHQRPRSVPSRHQASPRPQASPREQRRVLTPQKVPVPPPLQVPAPAPQPEFDVSVEAVGGGVVPSAVLDEAQRQADKEKLERHEYEQRTEARLQYLQQLKSSAKGKRKKQISKDAQQFPALEILEAFPDTSWINPRRGGSRFKNAPTQKGIYRFKNLGSGDATGNTKKFNLYRDNSGKPKAQKEGTPEEWQLDLHEHPEYFDKLIREQKI